MHAWMHRLVRTLYPYGAVRTVLRGPARRSRYVVAESMAATYALGFDTSHMGFMSRFLEAGMTVYDVGANRGQLTLFFSRAVGPGGRVVSFEPVPVEFAALEQNISLNSLSNVTPIRKALADTSGTASFAYASSRGTEGKLVSVESQNVLPGASIQDVDVARLDDLSESLPSPHLVKVDVEGGAAALFRGARETLERARPHIYLELHGPEEQAGVRDELVARGYRVSFPGGSPVEDPTAAWVSPLWCEPP